MESPFRIFMPNTSRPALACEIMSEGVLAARRIEGQQTTVAFVPFPVGALLPGIAAANFLDSNMVIDALRKAVGEVAEREKSLTLVIPDAAVRVLILDFDSFPAKEQEALPIVRFRLRKLVPFDVEEAAVSYQVVRQDKDQARILVTVMPSAIRSEYENAVRAAGYETGALLPSTLASLAALSADVTALVINRNGLSVTTAIVNGNDLMLHRTLELPEDDYAQREELVQTVLVASAYFEDTVHSPPGVLYYAGTGGSEEFAGIANPDGFGLQVRDLVPHAVLAARNAIPRGLAAGVTGALAV